MKICFTQSGGFVGAIKRHEIDSNSLPPAEAQQLRDLIQSSGLPHSAQGFDEHSADLRQYEITVQDTLDTFCVTFDEHTIPESVRPLLGFLLQQVRAGLCNGKKPE